MNSLERFHRIMQFDKSTKALKWEFGYWGSTIKNWYNQGLKEKKYPVINPKISTLQASIYTTAWIYQWKKQSNKDEKIELPNGIGVWGGGTYYPNQGFPLDHDVAGYFDFDKTTRLVEIEQLFFPKFDIKIISEMDYKLRYIDLDGIERIFLKKEATIPTPIKWVISDWKDWNEIKEQRLSLNNIKDRFPSNWNQLLEEYKTRDYPLAIGGYPLGIFGTLSHLLGYENLFFSFYDKPDLIRDILDTLTDLWIAIWEELISQIQVDCMHFWEDMSTGRSSMISPIIFKEFFTPYYKKINDFLKSKNVNIILLDTDGDCNELIPLFLEVGITGLYPMEASAGMDVLKARRKYPELQILGGIPKTRLTFGKEEIDKIIENIAELFKYGGYIPFGDHLIPPELSWVDFKYYRDKLNNLIDKNGNL